MSGVPWNSLTWPEAEASVGFNDQGLPIDSVKVKRHQIAQAVALHNFFFYCELARVFYWLSPQQMWVPITWDTLEHAIQEQLDLKCDDWFYPSDQDARKTANSIKNMATYSPQNKQKHYAQDPNLIACCRPEMERCMVYDLEAAEWRLARPLDFVYRTLPYNPLVDHSRPSLYHYTMGTMFPTESERRWVEAFMFYCCTHQIHLKKHLILVGLGDDGKTTFAAFLRAILGSSSVLAAFDSLFNLNGHGLTILHNKTLVISDEFPEGVLPSGMANMMKKVTGRTTEIDVNPKHRDPYNAPMYAKHMACANHLPSFSAAIDKALCGRYKIIGLESYVEDHPDPNRRLDGTRWEDIADHELEDVIHYLFDTYTHNYADYLVVDREETAARWVHLGGNVSRFLKEKFIIEVGSKHHIQKARLYEHYQVWCQQNNTEAIGQYTFYEAVLKRGCVDTRIRLANGSQPHVFRGIRAKEEVGEEISFETSLRGELLQKVGTGIEKIDLLADYSIDKQEEVAETLMALVLEGLIINDRGYVKRNGGLES